jgi:hypothetical protein
MITKDDIEKTLKGNNSRHLISYRILEIVMNNKTTWDVSVEFKASLYSKKLECTLNETDNLEFFNKKVNSELKYIEDDKQ